MNVLFTSINQQPIAIKLITIGSPTSGNHTYKTDTLTSSQQYSVGDWITTESGFIDFSYDIKSGQNSSNYYKFVTSGADLAISGLFKSIQNYAYCHLFDGCKTIVDASEVRFSGSQQKHMCEEMFANCTSLTVAPSTLPQGTGDWCCAGMFFNCTSLKDFPAAIKNTYSAKTGAFSWMFMNCTSLTGAPALNIFNSIAPYLYNSMFQNCTSLTDAPEIKLVAMREGCFKNMFMGCKNLSSITVNFASWDRDGTTDATENWVKGVASNGVFNKPNKLSAEYGISRIPVGWNRTLETITVDQIPAIEFEPVSFSASITEYVHYTGLEEVKYMVNGQLPNGVTFENGVFYCEPIQIESATVQLIVLADDTKPVISPVTIKAFNYTPLTFKCVSGRGKVSLYKNNRPESIEMKYSINDGEWQSYTVGDRIILSAVGDKVSFIGTNDHFSKDTNNYYYFPWDHNENVEVYGNIQSLMNYSLDCTSACYYKLFYRDRLIRGFNLCLPATGLASDCYREMFRNINSESFNTAPELPATTLAPRCYQSMFYGCINLTGAPELPATTLAEKCYRGMFYYCRSLTDAPSLPAVTLSSQCYAGMFEGCSKLSSIEVAFTNWSEDIGATGGWTFSVSSTGIFTKPSALPEEFGSSRIPYAEDIHWTVINK